jgi:hypothetical protein
MDLYALAKYPDDSFQNATEAQGSRYLTDEDQDEMGKEALVVHAGGLSRSSSLRHPW